MSCVKRSASNSLLKARHNLGETFSKIVYD